MGSEMNLIVTEETNIKLPELRGSIFRIKEKEGSQKNNEKLQQFLEQVFDKIQDLDNKQKYFQV